jgi:hypothetical protein
MIAAQIHRQQSIPCPEMAAICGVVTPASAMRTIPGSADEALALAPPAEPARTVLDGGA